MPAFLEAVGLSADDLTQVISQFKEESHAVADMALSLALLATALESEAVLDAVYAESADMRRSDVRVLVALAGHAFERLADGVAAIELASRLPADGEGFGPWNDAVQALSDAIEGLVTELGQAPTERNRG
ncbi:hypothetical protein ACGFNU_11280 [Spirillospora sp. NPDC048911]|uniref:hypothetical protein n=1 Tax=Spirillospora sp. NPDC048911 TaxID=3364527 RepID=UPI00371A08B4